MAHLGAAQQGPVVSLDNAAAAVPGALWAFAAGLVLLSPLALHVPCFLQTSNTAHA